MKLVDVARRAGVSAMSASRYERGESVPSVEVLWDLASALGVTPGELLDQSAEGDEIDTR